MGAVEVTVRLRTIDQYIRTKHGRPRSLTPGEMDIATRWVDKIVELVRSEWPIDTGTSYDNWTASLNPRGGQISITVSNDMYYAEYVHDGLWRSVVPRAVKAVKRLLISQLKTAILRTEERLESGADLRALLGGA